MSIAVQDWAQSHLDNVAFIDEIGVTPEGIAMIDDLQKYEWVIACSHDDCTFDVTSINNPYDRDLEEGKWEDYLHNHPAYNDHLSHCLPCLYENWDFDETSLHNFATYLAIHYPHKISADGCVDVFEIFTQYEGDECPKHCTEPLPYGPFSIYYLPAIPQ